MSFRRRSSTLRRAAAALGVVAALVVTATPAGANAPSPFEVAWTDQGQKSGSSYWTLVVGDSLLTGLAGVPAASMANHLTTTNNRSSYVVSAAGSSVPSWLNSGWLSGVPGPSLARLEDYVTVLKPKIVVLALGSNDSKLITNHSDDYDAVDHKAALVDAITKAKVWAKCVLLTTVADHWNESDTASVNAVNANIAWADLNITKVSVADWKATSTGHPEYFDGADDIHHTPTGELVYAALIGTAVKNLVQSGTCT